jgi:hypothetical protein
MKRLAFVLAWAALLAAPMAACNDVGDCPASSQIKPGGSCSGDQLECPYTVKDSPSPACDGTMVEGGLQTSCTCVSGTWSCPEVSCDATTGDDAGGDGTTTSEAGDASTASDGPGDGASMSEAAAETSSEAAPDGPGD